MVPETKQDDSKTFTGTLNRQRERRKGESERGRERWTGSEIGKSHGTPSRSGSESAKL